VILRSVPRGRARACGAGRRHSCEPGCGDRRSWIPAALAAALLVLAWPAAAAAQEHEDEGVAKLDYSAELKRRIARLESNKVEQLELGALEPGARPATEADRVRGGSRAIERVLEGQGIPRPPAGPRDVEREVAEIVAAETEALGAEKDALGDLARLPAPAPADVTGPPPPPPHDRAVHQVRSGRELSRFRSASLTPLTTDNRFVEYRLNIQDPPSARTQLRSESTFYESTLRTSGATIFNLQRELSRRYTGTLAGALALERYVPEQRANDSMLASGTEILVMHLPEGMDMSERYTYERKSFDEETIATLSTLTKILELRIEKRLRDGLARLSFLSNELDFPADRTLDLLRTDLEVGYFAPIHPKIDAEYTYLRQKENTSLSPFPAGDYRQSGNRIDLLFRFSPAMSLDVDIEFDHRNYREPDTVFISYKRTLWAPTLTVNQTRHLSYGSGFFEEVYYFREFDSTGEFVAALNDYRTQRWRLFLSYAKKRFTAAASVDFGETRYFRGATDLQSDYITNDTALSVAYDFDRDTRIAGSYTENSQRFRTFPENDNRSDAVNVEVVKRF
jgi:hypothetical protein